MSETEVIDPPKPDTGTPAPDAPKPDAGKDAPKERMFKVKLPDGKEETWPESKILERAQKSIGLEDRVTNAAKLEQAFASFVTRAQDPAQLVAILESPGIKYDEEKQAMLIEAMLNSKKPAVVQRVKKWLYENEVRPETLDPKDRELEELRSHKEKTEAEAKTRAEQQARAERDASVKKAWDTYRTKISETMQKEGIPFDNNEFFVSMVARNALLWNIYNRQTLAQNPQAPVKPVDIHECVKMAWQNAGARLVAMAKSLPEDKLIDFIGLETAQVINKALLKKLKDTEPETLKEERGPLTKRTPRESKDKVSAEETKRMLRNLERGVKTF